MTFLSGRATLLAYGLAKSLKTSGFNKLGLKAKVRVVCNSDFIQTFV